MNSDAMGKKIELEPESEAPFESREIHIIKDTWVNDQFDILEFLGR